MRQNNRESVLTERVEHCRWCLLLRWLAFVIWSGAILFFGLKPQVAVPDVQHADKILHAGAFALQALFLGRALLLHFAPGPALAAGSLFSILFGIVLEVAQATLTTSRTGDLFDVLANSSGVLLVWLLMLAYYKRAASTGKSQARHNKGQGW